MITPIDIQSKSFKSGIGYDKKDVDAFITEIMKNYEELYRSNVELKDKANMLNEGLQHYKNIEASLQKALVLAEKTSEETIRTAEEKARTIEKAAINKAKEHTADAKLELERVHAQTVSLVQQYTKFKSQFNQILNAQLELINTNTFDIQSDGLDAFANSTASANDSLNSTNPIREMHDADSNASISYGDSPLTGFKSSDDSGHSGAERVDPFAAATSSLYNYTHEEAPTKSFVDPFTRVQETNSVTTTVLSEAASTEDNNTFEGEIETKQPKRAMIGDDTETDTDFNFL